MGDKGPTSTAKLSTDVKEAAKSDENVSWRAKESLPIDKVVVHPLVLLSVVDHFNRMGKIGNQKRVVGILLGAMKGKGILDVSNSFAVPFDEDDKERNVWFLDHDYLENMYSMFKKHNAIIYLLQDIFNLLPDTMSETFVKSVYVKTNDQMLVVYLASLVRSVIALHNLINNKITNRDAEKKEGLKDKNGEKPTTTANTAGEGEKPVESKKSS
ncbi:26S proteasome non-ATPase regulatory subunit 7-like [Tetranychus urticae]|uniref:26S proteasome non-ATPase regulatory subunit 7-like n=1 Tax=Tetranychus urticae TaxID=32264 RepID=UPI00077B914C|nr:26S proteasome non-ATPase regulatory subunit 7-like [Tetranychus urticae]